MKKTTEKKKINKPNTQKKVIKSNKKVRQIFDLNDCKEMCGIYVLVLDEYKQVYIGQAKDIKKRVMQHWSKQKPFDRLIFGGVNNSVLSIDCFGALDTTRIFVLETTSLDSASREGEGRQTGDSGRG